MVDFKEQLRRQITFIENSCQTYDRGAVEEAVRIAVALRVLFHDSTRSRSLLIHMGRKMAFSLLSTAAPFVADPVIPNFYLVQIVANLTLVNQNRHAEFRCHCVPRLDGTTRKALIPFQAWWKKERVITHKQPPTALTRRDLVLAAANKDGGAHVDNALDPTYDYVRLGSGLTIEIDLNPKLGLPTQKASFENIHFASLRQTAFEVLNSPSVLALR